MSFLFWVLWAPYRGDPAIPFPPRRAGLRRRGPHSFLRIGATLGSLVERPGGRPARLTQARKRICEAWPLMRPDGEERGGLRGSASYTALPCSEPPSNPPALGLGRRRGHTRRPRELAGAVGEGATPCTDGRPSENTPPWLGLHQSSLPNAAKGYPPREPRETPLSGSQHRRGGASGSSTHGRVCEDQQTLRGGALRIIGLRGVLSRSQGCKGGTRDQSAKIGAIQISGRKWAQ